MPIRILAKSFWRRRRNRHFFRSFHLFVQGLESRSVLSGVPSLINLHESDPLWLHSASNLTAVGDEVFFTADGAMGRELWKSDGTAAGTVIVKDIRPGSESSNPVGLTAVGNTLFFLADDGVTGRELWRSDGTAEGTVLVADIRQGSVGSAAESLTAVGTILFFSADDGVHGPELWRSDGTSADTIMAKDILTGSVGSAPSGLTVADNGSIWFVANDGTHGRELWKSDGTNAGTVLVYDIQPGEASSSPTSFAAYQGLYDGVTHVYFTANDGSHGEEFWKSDGSLAGTVLVKDIRPGPVGSSPGEVTLASGAVWLRADDGVHGAELWSSDGTSGGTVVHDVRWFGSTGSEPVFLKEFNGNLFFRADDGNHGQELWMGDAFGNVAIVANISPLYGDASPGWLTAGSTALFFTATDPTDGLGLYRTNGSVNDTIRLKKIADEGPQFMAEQLTAVGDRIFFVLDDGTGNGGLWQTDGTGDGTLLVKPFRTEPPLDSESAPSLLTAVGTDIFFTADSPIGRELWKSDGTAAGTGLVKDIHPGAPGASLFWMTAVGTTLYFTADDGVHGHELWKSDGTAAGTILVRDIGSGSDALFGPQLLTPVGSTLFFTVNDGVHGAELWKSDGSLAGTVLVKDIQPGMEGAGIESLTACGSLVYFTAYDDVHGYQLWKSDGTEAGTVIVNETPFTGDAYDEGTPRDLTAVAGTLFFTANDGIHGRELWRTDGSALGTVLVKDINSGSGSSYASWLTSVGGTLSFTAFDGVHGHELWRSDGTEAGTALVADIHAGGLGSEPQDLTVVTGVIFFTADDGLHGRELWTSDATAAGTRLVKDITATVAGPFVPPSNLTAVGGTLFFTADDEVHGTEVWQTDGTTAGTMLVHNIQPDDWIGGARGNPESLVAAGNTLFLSADDLVHGRELWALTPMTAVSQSWTIFEAAVIADKNIFFAVHASGSIHRLQADARWSTIGGLTGIGNAYSIALPRSARGPDFSVVQSPEPLRGDLLIPLEISGGVLRVDALGRLYADGTMLTEGDGNGDGILLTAVADFTPIAVMRENSDSVWRNTVLWRNRVTQELLEWSFTTDWAYSGHSRTPAEQVGSLELAYQVDIDRDGTIR